MTEVYANGKEYKSLTAIGSRIQYLRERVELRPEQQEEFDYLNYAMSTYIRHNWTPQSFTRWRYPGYERRNEQDLTEWSFAIKSIGMRYAVLAMIKDEVHYRVGIYKTLREAEEVFKSQRLFLITALKDGRTKAAFLLSRPA